jgi:hypothetical protein
MKRRQVVKKRVVDNTGGVFGPRLRQSNNFVAIRIGKHFSGDRELLNSEFSNRGFPAKFQATGLDQRLAVSILPVPKNSVKKRDFLQHSPHMQPCRAHRL